MLLRHGVKPAERIIEDGKLLSRVDGSGNGLSLDEYLSYQ